ncbi:hypothetical protein DQ04_00041220 [Trypanosoma grayi]|uniref:hypothetical protein n=1 Tax=Trypanosoma grayi TaxID=71804 RepID=UPI0004F4283E|nr:hypothetical protein DQ04_00041220 [Trypanosoma grayi]KEG15558.1 hypothetical protein DQ04_00041220 [Trypanosoma grayi]
MSLCLEFVLLSQLFIFCMVSSLTAAEGLPDCRTMEPFLSHESHTATSPATAIDDLSLACLLRPGTAAALLLGSPEGRLLSPLRGRWHSDGTANQYVGSTLDDEAKLSMLSRVTQFWHRLCVYPWGDPAAVERFFFQRQLRLSFEVNVESDTKASGGQIFSMAVMEYVRATSFQPTAVRVKQTGEADTRDVQLACNFTRVLEMRRATGEASSSLARSLKSLDVVSMISLLFGGSGGNGRGNAASSSSQRMEMESVYVFEELGPHRRNSLWVPSWVAAWFGSRPMETTETLLRGEDGHHQFVLEAHLPVAKPVCLRLAAVVERGLIVHIEESLVFDAFWLKHVLLLCLVRLLQPSVEDIPALQIFLAGMGSVVVLCGFVALFVLRKLQNMTLGKLGLVTVIAMGGLPALVESILSAASALIYTYFRNDDGSDLLFHLTWVLILIGLICGLFAKFLWASYLASLTRWTLRCVQLGILSCAALQNREATLVFVTTAVVLSPSRIFRFILWCSRSSGLENRENDPQEKLPSAARRAVAYAPPLCVEGLIGGSRALSAEKKLQLYDTLGNEYTQRALHHLAEQLRKEPERYAARLSDPKGASSWARKYN